MTRGCRELGIGGHEGGVKSLATADEDGVFDGEGAAQFRMRSASGLGGYRVIAKATSRRGSDALTDESTWLRTTSPVPALV